MLYLSHAQARTCPKVQMSAHVFERSTQQCASNMQTSDRKPVLCSAAPLKPLYVLLLEADDCSQADRRPPARQAESQTFVSRGSRCCWVRCLPQAVQPKVLRGSMETAGKYLKFVPSPT